VRDKQSNDPSIERKGSLFPLRPRVCESEIDAAAATETRESEKRKKSREMHSAASCDAMPEVVLKTKRLRWLLTVF